MITTAGFVLLGHAPGDAWTAAWLVGIAVVILWRHQNNVIGWWRQRRLR